MARDSAAANHKRELAAAQRDAAQVEAQHKSAAASWHTDLDWHRSEVRLPYAKCLLTLLTVAVGKGFDRLAVLGPIAAASNSGWVHKRSIIGP